MQTNKTDELMGILRFSRPETLAAFSNQRFTTISHCVACRSIKRGREELHDPWVSIECGEWFTVSWKPLPQTEAFSLEFYQPSHFAKIVHDDL